MSIKHFYFNYYFKKNTSIYYIYKKYEKLTEKNTSQTGIYVRRLRKPISIYSGIPWSILLKNCSASSYYI